MTIHHPAPPQEENRRSPFCRNASSHLSENVATPAGLEPATFSLEGYRETPRNQRQLTHFQGMKPAILSRKLTQRGCPDDWDSEGRTSARCNPWAKASLSNPKQFAPMIDVMAGEIELDAGLAFPADWPPDCPPEAASCASAVVFRVVRQTPLSREDFLSFHELGKDVRNRACEARGLSVFLNSRDAQHA